jgi:hypothetical protein
MSFHVNFEPLPDTAGRRNKHEAIAAELRARPGAWAHILTVAAQGTATSMAYMVRVARFKAYGPAGTFEARSRTIDGEFRVYARYVGKEAPVPVDQAAEVLRIVSEVTTEANDVGGVDINDLVTRLEQAGYQLPDDEQP